MWTNLSGQSSTYPLVEYVYNGFGQVKDVKTYTQQSGTARTTTYTYDKNGRVTAIDHPSPLGDEYFAYDDVGNLIGKKDGAAVVTAYEYDALNRLVKVDYNHTSWPPGTISSADVTYSYDVGSRLVSQMTDPHSVRPTRYTYDEFDRLETYKPATPRTLGEDEEHDSNVRKIEYVYNNLNQKTQMTQKLDTTTVHTTDYAYFKNGWLKNVQWDSSTIAEYTYNSVGNRTKIEYGNPTYTVFEYDGDPRYRIEGVTHWIEGSPDSELLGIAYTRDGAGNPLTMDDGDPTEYDYDENSRLDSVTYPGPTQVSFGYDWVGNRLNPPAAPNPMEYNAADQLTRWAEHHQYEYLDTGSLYEQYDDDDPRVLEKTYTYSPANLLTKVVHGDDPENDPASEMTWDADGNRVSFTRSTSGGGTWQFVYDATAGIPAVVEEYDGSASVYYIREPGGELIARYWMEGENEYLLYYHFDALGSTRLLTDNSGDVTDTYTYDAWGRQIDHTGDTGQPYRFVGQLGYYTHYQDTNLFTENDWQLLHLGVRFYDAEVGRFTQLDATRNGRNWYAYCGDDPSAHIDPTGLAPMTVNPRGYQICLGKKGRTVWTYERWCRKEKRLNKWEFAKCVGRGCWKTIAQAAACAALCWKSPGPQAFVACHVECMMSGPESGATLEDVETIRKCYRDNTYDYDAEYVRNACHYIENGPYGTITGDYVDKAEPSGSGWDRCEED